MSVCPNCNVVLGKLIQRRESIIHVKALAEYVPYYLCSVCRKEIEGISSLKEARDFLKKPPAEAGK